MDDNCHVDPIQKTITAEERHTTTSALIAVWGMGCPNCAARVRNSLLLLTGVVEAQVLLELGMANVTYNPNLTNIPALINAVAQAGGGDGRHTYRAELVNGPGVEFNQYA
ncbi:MAG TPA: heavy metal-associated domain-containing protein [Anaerolineales bacterium]|nr:heavy metal-associated domain-containing protein [Anaerolineales bacterium]